MLRLSNMAFIHLSVVFSLMALCSSAPLECSDTVKPIAIWNPNEVYGKWFIIAASNDYKPYIDMFKTFRNSWMDLQPVSDSNFTIKQGMLFEKCIWTTEYFTMTNHSGLLTYTMRNNTSGTFMATCPNCLLMSFTSLDGSNVAKSFYIFARSRKFEASDLEKFKQQVECLGLPPPVFIDNQETELCPEEGTSVITSHPEPAKPDEDLKSKST
ncbi:uncharacterized protein LOC117423066 [Acipenser ruthenus]|uniref:uncharacterized protein LOC117423066 n=1 Tax=Acipenser ruthenus TaxID=7906 RepID=UPI0027422A81|nr:uncharacterized protein LOC117423066 [Acipenser ruthenus]